MLTASVLILATLAGYALLCAVKPFGPCRKCRGSGIREVRKGFKMCRRCHGQCYRLRVGRRLLNTSREIHRTGSR
ncbi:hypothetical protein E2C00_27585 [Streptomyces sp. WAC05374]|uniref:hypothetical protein n=1 Tax=Streptomyces sp. WAC05374 TaxID=2487420 RepID=UPI000F86FD0A|nr:hypothetical protein [Streptomyces sp. WAC05374]RST18540.1 hypothetical protein EF905_04850 [Streptomyces sp. WAC05374]TDF43280.1 hypothetical protein E2B92_20440 [Streptomyces sp. WAC05374]TDF51066.1 hypothetical protein E2C00_27585 [Streptomyces sp. WAC05374]TDF52191.1 hypothetical protein E2C02_21580 [Streptomyces sp. WAC05374]